ncbi:Sedoheptulokinase [Merluccius polli]|uniref:Sedoheptulokinase n=1 Tax=Merluccius polli TaxID=89951 RepID=A0AA47P2Q0_MERPO|nr:Sedoheptulokinase [Merluccius polli]KAK0150854.1 Sedoheptulokinase [Merluccius polli]
MDKDVVGAGEYVLGVDIGTTSVKAVRWSGGGSRSISHAALAHCCGRRRSHSGLQTTNRRLAQLYQLLTDASPSCQRRLVHVSSIGVSGQMHGVVLWKPKTGKEMLLCIWAVIGRTETLRGQGHQSVGHLAGWPLQQSLPVLASHTELTPGRGPGFGCATIFWPEFLSDFSVAGTIQDYVVCMLCGLDRCVMTPHNAASWGFFNTTTSQWNTEMGCHGGPPMLCLLRMTARRMQVSDLLLPSAQHKHLGQLTYAMPGDFRPPDAPVSGSPVSYFPFFDESYLAVAASLNGQRPGHFCRNAQFMDERLGVCFLSWDLFYPIQNVPCVPSSSFLCRCGAQRPGGEPRPAGRETPPTAPGRRGQHLCRQPLLGHVIRALCRGILDNLTSMMPWCSAGGGGEGVVGQRQRSLCNAVLREEAEGLHCPWEYGKTADSAVGVAMVVCDRL